MSSLSVFIQLAHTCALPLSPSFIKSCKSWNFLKKMFLLMPFNKATPSFHYYQPVVMTWIKKIVAGEVSGCNSPLWPFFSCKFSTKEDYIKNWRNNEILSLDSKFNNAQVFRSIHLLFQVFHLVKYGDLFMGTILILSPLGGNWTNRCFQ